MKLKNKDIAKILGISTTAVSLAINNKPGVSAETRRKVYELLNSSLQQEASVINQENKNSGMRDPLIVMCVHKKHGEIINDKPFFSELIETAQQTCMAHHYMFSIVNYSVGQDISSYMHYLKSMEPYGLVIVATEMDIEDLEYYKALNIPMVLIDSTFDLEEFDSVSLDNSAAIYKTMHYARNLGHMNIGYLASSVTINNFRHRMDGFLKGLRDFGLEDYNHPVISLPPDTEKAREAMSLFLDSPPEAFAMPTIFLSDLDYIALGAMQALKEHGYRIPDDVSIIGFDDVMASALSEPPLTTIRVNHGTIAGIAVKILIDNLAEPNKTFFSTIQVSSQFIIRDSVRRL